MGCRSHRLPGPRYGSQASWSFVLVDLRLVVSCRSWLPGTLPGPSAMAGEIAAGLVRRQFGPHSRATGQTAWSPATQLPGHGSGLWTQLGSRPVQQRVQLRVQLLCLDFALCICCSRPADSAAQWAVHNSLPSAPAKHLGLGLHQPSLSPVYPCTKHQVRG